MTMRDLCFVEEIDRGAYGVVNLFVDVDTGKRRFAVKKTDTGGREQSKKVAEGEAKVLAKMRHFNIVRMFSHEHRGNSHYIIQEHLANGTLHRFIGLAKNNADRAGNRVHMAHYWLAQLADGIRYMHLKGFAHCDVKPKNLLISSNGALRIADFGLSVQYRKGGSATADALKMFTHRRGSQPYMAPEVYAQDGSLYEGPPTDVWSCGIVLFELLTGKRPWMTPAPVSKRFVDFAATGTSEPLRKCLEESGGGDSYSCRSTSVLLLRMLDREPRLRLSAREVVNHEALSECNDVSFMMGVNRRVKAVLGCA